MNEFDPTSDHLPDETDAYHSSADAEESYSWPASAGRYQIRQELARGGMGAVLRAYDPDFDRPLAIKVMLRTDHEEGQRRFHEEARIAAQLQHPGVAPLYDLGKLDNGSPFFAMKLIEGDTLADLLRERKSTRDDLPRFLMIFEQICQTVAYAHSCRVLHRDLKPANIMVGAFGEVQVMDWGLAKVLSPDDQEVGTDLGGLQSTVDPRWAADSGSHTQPGQVVGTPSFIAPEQARGELDSLDERCDVFGLGGILAVVLTNTAPFESDSATTSINQAREGDVGIIHSRLSKCQADPAIVQLAQDCLAAGTADRPASAQVVARRVADFRSAMQERLRQAEIAQASAQVQAREETKRRRITQIAAAVCFLLLGAAVIGWNYYKQARDAQIASQREQMSSVRSSLAAADGIATALTKRLQVPIARQELFDQPQLWMAKLDQIKSHLQTINDTLKSVPVPLEVKGQVEALTLRLAELDRDRQLAIRLEKARLQKGTWHDHKFDEQGALLSFIQIFSDAFDWDGRSKPSAATIARLTDSPMRDYWLTVLYEWADLAKDTEHQKIHLEIRKWLAAVDQESSRHEIIQRLEKDPTQASAFIESVLGSRQHRELSAGDASLVASHLPWQSRIRARWLRTTLGYHPSDFWLHFGLANTLFRTDASQAEAHFRAAIAIRPRLGTGWQNLASLFHSQKRWMEAEQALRQALQFEDENVFVWTHLGFMQSMRNDPKSVESFAKAKKINSEYAPLWGNLGFTQLFSHDHAAAKASFKKAVELDPNHGLFWLNLGLVQRLLGEREEALQATTKATELMPNSVDAWENLGTHFYSGKEYKRAVTAYKKALKLSPKRLSVLLSLGHAHFHLEEYDQAIGLLREAVMVAPHDATAWNLLGNSLRLLERRQEAEHCFREAIKIDPKHVSAHYNLGLLEVDRAEFKTAIKLMTQALNHCKDERYRKIFNTRYLVRRLSHFKPQIERVLDKGESAVPGRLVELADLCYRYQRRFHDSVRLYEQAFTKQDKLVESTVQHEMHGLRAAASALRAAEFGSSDLSLSPPQERRRLRKLALGWIQRCLTACQTVAKKDAKTRGRILRDVQSWTTNRDFRAVRDPQLVRQLRRSERTEWKKFWADHAAAIQTLR